MANKPKFRNSKVKPLALGQVQLSDSNKLIWANVSGTMEAAAKQFNAMRATVYEETARSLALRQGIDLDRYNFDVTTGTWVRRVKMPADGGGPVGRQSA